MNVIGSVIGSGGYTIRWRGYKVFSRKSGADDDSEHAECGGVQQQQHISTPLIVPFLIHAKKICIARFHLAGTADLPVEFRDEIFADDARRGVADFCKTEFRFSKRSPDGGAPNALPEVHDFSRTRADANAKFSGTLEVIVVYKNKKGILLPVSTSGFIDENVFRRGSNEGPLPVTPGRNLSTRFWN